MLILGVQGAPIPFDTVTMVLNSLKIQGHLAGTAEEAEETVEFALKHGVKSMNQVFDFKDAQKAFDDMMVCLFLTINLARNEFPFRLANLAFVMSCECSSFSSVHALCNLKTLSVTIRNQLCNDSSN